MAHKRAALRVDQKKWVYLIILALIWGTSYILIKKGLQGFTPLQLGAVRILLAALFLGVIGGRSLSKLSRHQWKWIAISGFLGSFFPVFLFAYAQKEIDSGITAVLNSMVPLFTLFVGRFLFGTAIRPLQLVGVLFGFIGALGLILVGAQIHADQNYSYALLILLAAFGYACNANIIKAKLHGASPLAIATGNFAVIALPALIILPLSGFFTTEILQGPLFLEFYGISHPFVRDEYLYCQDHVQSAYSDRGSRIFGFSDLFDSGSRTCLGRIGRRDLCRSADICCSVHS